MIIAEIRPRLFVQSIEPTIFLLQEIHDSIMRNPTLGTRDAPEIREQHSGVTALATHAGKVMALWLELTP